MNIIINYVFIILSSLSGLPASTDGSGGPQQTAPAAPGTPGFREAFDIVVSTPRMDIPLKENPAATTVVGEDALQAMPRTVAADEALKLVPGVKVDNQANGERVHMSIRGQGILTERGIRGINVLLDGLPMNDPTGFAPDLFDVDWATVESIEVLKGPAGSLYGAGSSGGVLNIATRDGAPSVARGDGLLNSGSYGFYKASAECGGTSGDLNYRVSGSRTAGDGYRDQTGFWANNFYGKLNIGKDDPTHFTGIVAMTDYFNENAEGLNLEWLREDRTMANPDALTYNEYQKTRRITGGLTGKIRISDSQECSIASYFRHTRYRESVPSSVQHRDLDSPGFNLQYALHSTLAGSPNHLGIGADLSWQLIDEFRHPNLGRAVEGPELLSDQSIRQRGTGVYLLDRVELGSHWGVAMSLRHDRIRNELDDHLRADGVDLSGEASFQKSSGRIGATWNPSPSLGVYASYGVGFLPPATEELANNPDHLGGFNEHLVPATSRGEEFGARGFAGQSLLFDVAVFHMDTDNDFGRYRMPSRPLETFYRNVGSSRRYGLETLLGWYPSSKLAAQLAYTYSHFKYTEYRAPDGDFAGNWLPNSPRHQAYLDLRYDVRPGWRLGASVEALGQWYVDASNKTSVGGYALLHARVAYRHSLGRGEAEVMLSGRNLTAKEYIAFTEPDPDGNSYQPAPTREIFLGAQISFGGA